MFFFLNFNKPCVQPPYLIKPSFVFVPVVVNFYYSYYSMIIAMYSITFVCYFKGTEHTVCRYVTVSKFTFHQCVNILFSTTTEIETLRIFNRSHSTSAVLRKRMQYMYRNGYWSYPFASTAGVPPGSNLEPLLLLLFIMIQI